jgi:hypothetical protein
MPQTRFEVQTYTICDGWVNCWMVGDDDELETFATEAEALAAIAEHIKDYEAAVVAGDCVDAPAEDEFRVVPLETP